MSCSIHQRAIHPYNITLQNSKMASWKKTTQHASKNLQKAVNHWTAWFLSNYWPHRLCYQICSFRGFLKSDTIVVWINQFDHHNHPDYCSLSSLHSAGGIHSYFFITLMDITCRSCAQSINPAIVSSQLATNCFGKLYAWRNQWKANRDDISLISVNLWSVEGWRRHWCWEKTVSFLNSGTVINNGI